MVVDYFLFFRTPKSETPADLARANGQLEMAKILDTWWGCFCHKLACSAVPLDAVTATLKIALSSRIGTVAVTHLSGFVHLFNNAFVLNDFVCEQVQLQLGSV